MHEGMLGRWGVIRGEGASSPSVACGGGLHEVPLELACPGPWDDETWQKARCPRTCTPGFHNPTSPSRHRSSAVGAGELR